MSKQINLTGNKYGRWLVINKAEKREPGGKILWHCLCDCGRESIVRGSHLRQGNTSSCGCLRNEQLSKRMSTHRASGTNTYESWSHAKARVTNKNSADWPSWGGRGITMCDKWLDSFEAFLEDLGVCPPGLTLERIDNNGNYAADNCRWATRTEQNNNRRDNVLIEHMGKITTMSQYCRALGLIDHLFIKYHRKHGSSVVMATAKVMSFHIRQALEGNRPWPKFTKTTGGIAKEQLK